MDYKIEELKERIESYLKDNLYEDLHNHAFNDDYYIIGTYKAKQWLGDQAMEVVAYIQNYQKDNWGEDQIETFLDEDGSIDYERIVNIYTYIRGQELVWDFIENWEKNYKNFDAWLERECDQAKYNIEHDIYKAKQKYATV